MTNSVSSAGVSAGEAPRPVSRGVNLHSAFLGMDSLYLVLEYPDRDVFDYWSSLIEDLDIDQFRDGIPVGRFLIRRGAIGYKLSVWDGDARMFITDRVDNALQKTGSAGQGMGIMLQLGPLWLCRYGDILSPDELRENVFAQLRKFRVPYPDRYPIRINRLDIALDVVGLPVVDISIDEWRRGWVGYAQRKFFYDSSQTGLLEGFAIGSSSGAVRFKVYDKLSQSASVKRLNFWLSVWKLPPDGTLSAVTRFEWSTKPYGARFVRLGYLNEFTPLGFMDLLNYVSLKWGRLCVPSADVNRSRWELAPVWLAVREIIEDWTIHYTGVASRAYEFRPDLNKGYLKSASGWVAGLMARVGLENRSQGPVSVADALALLRAEGLSPAHKATHKFAVLSRLYSEVTDNE